eukprot:283847-Chlamydomonas_euryale.AAC.2
MHKGCTQALRFKHTLDDQRQHGAPAPSANATDIVFAQPPHSPSRLPPYPLTTTVGSLSFAPATLPFDHHRWLCLLKTFTRLDAFACASA